MKILKSYNSFLNESYKKGDFVKLRHGIEQNPDDGEYGYSIDDGEVGEIRYIVDDNEREENKVYMVKFPDRDGKKRYMQLTQMSFEKE